MGIEVEARYLVPDRVLFDKLLRLESLGGYTLTPQGTLKIMDHYLDTKGRALTHQGWACRLRSQDGAWMVTLKGPKEVQGSIVSRSELEMPLARRLDDIARWPHGELRERARELTSGLPLRRLLTIRQIRHSYLVSEGPRQVAELSLDVVYTSGKGTRHRYYMLECELLEQGQVTDLERLNELFVKSCYLIPEARSKLQRALELIELGSSADEGLLHTGEPMTVETLCERYDLNLPQAMHVANLADALYERLQPLHQLAESRRPLLHVAALLHNVGETTDRAERHIVSRDIILRQPITGLDEEAQAIVAAAAYLHRKRITPKRIEQAFPRPVSEEAHRDALVIAALLRMAVALDDSGAQGTFIQAIELVDKRARIAIAGPYAAEDVEQARARSDLWADLFGTLPEWHVLEIPRVGDAAERPDIPPKERIGLLPGDTMSEVAGKVLRFHFERMLRREAGTRLGKDPEELHDMRVATRRLRSAMGLFRAYLGGRYLWPCASGLRELAHALGEVRDMDVALERAQRYLATQPPQPPIPPTRSGVGAIGGQRPIEPIGGQPPSEGGSLEPLLEEWRSRREEARQRMLAHLDSQAYSAFLGTFGDMLEDLGSAPRGFSESYLATQVAPRTLYIRWQAVCAYGPILENAPIELLHALRIDGKHLRYALEFFREVLPAKAALLIPEVVALQDHLGGLHDAAVALQMLDELLSARADADLRGISAYRQACHLELMHLLRTFPAAWKRFSESRPQRELGDILLGR
jgi:CHAD domain-containing protein/inorganic triphosphatase YgiF